MFDSGELVLPRRHRLQRIFLDVGRFAHLIQFQPIGVEVHALHVDAERPERVDVGMAEARPVFEFDAQLERRLGLAHEIVLVDAERAVEDAQLRDRGFADADRADFFGLNQADFAILVLQEAPQRCGRHPAGGAPANNHDPAQFVIAHWAAPSRAGAPAAAAFGAAAQCALRNSRCVGIASAARLMAASMPRKCFFTLSMSTASTSGS